MIRKLILPVAAAALLAGCITTAPYGYRGGDQGDYYYGQPSVEYRHYGVYPGYGSPYYGPYRPGFHGYYGRGGYGYGYPYGGYGGYGRGWYGHPGYPPVYRPVPRPRPDHRPDTRADGGPWRNIDQLRRRHGDPGPSGVVTTPEPPRAQPISPPPSRAVLQPRPREDRGSARGEMMRRRSEGVPPASQQEE